MKTIFKVMFLLCTIGLVPSVAKAQEKVIIDDEASNGIVMVTIDKAGDEIIRIMNESQFRYIHDPQAPRFLLMDKKGKFALGIGGYVRATAEYDFGGIVDNMDFIPAYIPNASKVKNQFQIGSGYFQVGFQCFTVRGSNLHCDHRTFCQYAFSGSGGNKFWEFWMVCGKCTPETGEFHHI